MSLENLSGEARRRIEDLPVLSLPPQDGADFLVFEEARLTSKLASGNPPHKGVLFMSVIGRSPDCSILYCASETRLMEDRTFRVYWGIDTRPISTSSLENYETFMPRPF
jgi:hypothetical protein